MSEIYIFRGKKSIYLYKKKTTTDNKKKCYVRQKAL